MIYLYTIWINGGGTHYYFLRSQLPLLWESVNQFYKVGSVITQWHVISDRDNAEMTAMTNKETSKMFCHQVNYHSNNKTLLRTGDVTQRQHILDSCVTGLGILSPASHSSTANTFFKLGLVNTTCFWIKYELEIISQLMKFFYLEGLIRRTTIPKALRDLSKWVKIACN